jgi:transposase
MAALEATQKNPGIRKYYLKLLEKEMPKKLALIACMRKRLLTIHDSSQPAEVGPNKVGP